MKTRPEPGRYTLHQPVFHRIVMGSIPVPINGGVRQQAYCIQFEGEALTYIQPGMVLKAPSSTRGQTWKAIVIEDVEEISATLNP